jgi:hypothetical protein
MLPLPAIEPDAVLPVDEPVEEPAPVLLEPVAEPVEPVPVVDPVPVVLLPLVPVPLLLASVPVTSTRLFTYCCSCVLLPPCSRKVDMEPARDEPLVVPPAVLPVLDPVVLPVPVPAVLPVPVPVVLPVPEPLVPVPLAPLLMLAFVRMN